MSQREILLLRRNLANRGGVEKYTLHIAKAFSQHGHKVKILTTGKPPLFTEDGIDIFSIGDSRSITLLNLHQYNKAVEEYLKEHPSSIIFGMDRTYSQTHHRAGEGIHAGYLHQRSYSEGRLKKISIRFNPLHHYLLNLEKKMFQNSKLKILFTNSHMVKREAMQYYDISEEKIKVVHNGVEWEELSEPFEASLERASSEKYEFLFIGNGYKRKGLDLLLKSLSQLQRKDIHLSVVGKEKKLHSYQRIAKRLGLENIVSFYGPQNNIIPFYQKADALLIPSIYDPFANVTMEALAMGLYVISSKSNGGHEILSTDNGAIIEDLYDIDSITTSLKQALSHPKTPKSATAIRESVRSYNFKQQLEKIVTLTLSHDH